MATRIGQRRALQDSGHITFMTVVPVLILSGEPVGWQIWVTPVARPLTDGGNMEDTRNRVLRNDICVSTATGRSRGKDVKEE